MNSHTKYNKFCSSCENLDDKDIVRVLKDTWPDFKERECKECAVLGTRVIKLIGDDGTYSILLANA